MPGPISRPVAFASRGSNQRRIGTPEESSDVDRLPYLGELQLGTAGIFQGHAVCGKFYLVNGGAGRRLDLYPLAASKAVSAPNTSHFQRAIAGEFPDHGIGVASGAPLARYVAPRTAATCHSGQQDYSGDRQQADQGRQAARGAAAFAKVWWERIHAADDAVLNKPRPFGNPFRRAGRAQRSPAP